MWPALLAVGAGALGAIGTMKQANAQAAAMRTNAAINRQNAQLRQQVAAVEEGRVRREGGKILAKTRVNALKSGVTLSGSILDIIGENARNIELDALNVRYQGALDAYNFMVGAAQEEAGAKNTIRAGRLAAATKLLAAGAQAGSYGFGGGAKTPPPKTSSPGGASNFAGEMQGFF